MGSEHHRNDDDDKVKELLQQCSDEAVLELFSTDSCLEGSLEARFERLKGVGLAGDRQSASRLEALKSFTIPASETVSSNFKPSSDAVEVDKLSESTSQQARLEKLKLPAQNNDGGKTIGSSEVEKLLESISDEVRLEKSRLPAQHRVGDEMCHFLDEDVSDSEVNKIVEWAKDAAALEPQEDLEEDPVAANKVSTVEVPKKRKSFWKIW